MHRLRVIAEHVVAPDTTTTTNTNTINQSSTISSFDLAPVASSSPLPKRPDDVVIVSAVRTAIGKAGRGSLKDLGLEELLVPVFKHILSTTGIEPALIGDIVIGNVLPKSGGAATEVRIASLLAGFPKEVPVHVCNRQCSSGLQAIATVAASIKAGYYDIGIGGGVESMSKHKMSFEGDISQAALEHDMAQGCYLPMGETSENVAERFSVPRDKQDRFAVESNKKAAAAIKSGKFKEEIVPLQITVDNTTKVFDTDEGVRETTTFEGLQKLKPAFKENGTSTAGNSSQVSDGASACLLMKRALAEKLRLPILGTFRSFSVIGVEPAIMGVGPAEAIPEAVRKAGLTLDQIDVFEINEAFASQAIYCIEKLGIDYKKVNPNGGAIALGHPLGCTGSRMTASLLHELKRRKARFGVVSMCIGSGMGAAAVYESE